MNIRELLQELNIPVAPESHRHATTGWVNIDCPYCSPGTNKCRLGIPKGNPWIGNCWACGRVRIDKILHNLGCGSLKKARAILGQVKGDRLLNDRFKATGKLEMPKGSGKLQSRHRKYLEKREFNPKEMEDLWDIQGVGISTEYQWRIVIPITLNGKIVSWTTRACDDKSKNKYMTAPPSREAIHHKDILYGLDHAHGDTVLVVEGPTDVWRIGPGAVCTFGTSWTESQMALLRNYRRRYILFDPETMAQRLASKLFHRLNNYNGETGLVSVSDWDGDIGDLRYQDVAALRKDIGLD